MGQPAAAHGPHRGQDHRPHGETRPRPGAHGPLPPGTHEGVGPHAGEHGERERRLDHGPVPRHAPIADDVVDGRHHRGREGHDPGDEGHGPERQHLGLGPADEQTCRRQHQGDHADVGGGLGVDRRSEPSVACHREAVETLEHQVQEIVRAQRAVGLHGRPLGGRAHLESRQDEGRRQALRPPRWPAPGPPPAGGSGRHPRGVGRAPGPRRRRRRRLRPAAPPPRAGRRRRSRPGPRRTVRRPRPGVGPA